MATASVRCVCGDLLLFDEDGMQEAFAAHLHSHRFRDLCLPTDLPRDWLDRNVRRAPDPVPNHPH